MISDHDLEALARCEQARTDPTYYRVDPDEDGLYDRPIDEDAIYDRMVERWLEG